MSEFRNYNEEGKSRWETRWEQRMERHHDGKGHIWTGFFLLAIGGLALARSMGVPIPNWLFSWQMLVIAIGLFIGFRKGFRDGGWFVPVIIGGAFLANGTPLGPDDGLAGIPLLHERYLLLRRGKRSYHLVEVTNSPN